MQGIDLQHARDRLAVADVAGEAAVEQRIEGDALEVDELVLVRMLGAEGQSGGHVKVQHLREAAGGGEDLAEGGERFAARARFLAQLAPRGGGGVLPALELAGGDLLEHGPERVAVLLHGQHVVVFVDGDDGDAARVVDHLARGEVAVGQPHGVHAQVDDAPVENFLTADKFFIQFHFFAFFRLHTLSR